MFDLVGSGVGIDPLLFLNSLPKSILEFTRVGTFTHFKRVPIGIPKLFQAKARLETLWAELLSFKNKPLSPKLERAMGVSDDTDHTQILIRYSELVFIDPKMHFSKSCGITSVAHIALLKRLIYVLWHYNEFINSFLDVEPSQLHEIIEEYIEIHKDEQYEILINDFKQLFGALDLPNKQAYMDEISSYNPCIGWFIYKRCEYYMNEVEGISQRLQTSRMRVSDLEQIFSIYRALDNAIFELESISDEDVDDESYFSPFWTFNFVSKHSDDLNPPLLTANTETTAFSGKDSFIMGPIIDVAQSQPGYEACTYKKLSVVTKPAPDTAMQAYLLLNNLTQKVFGEIKDMMQSIYWDECAEELFLVFASSQSSKFDELLKKLIFTTAPGKEIAELIHSRVVGRQAISELTYKNKQQEERIQQLEHQVHQMRACQLEMQKEHDKLASQVAQLLAQHPRPHHESHAPVSRLENESHSSVSIVGTTDTNSFFQRLLDHETNATQAEGSIQHRDNLTLKLRRAVEKQRYMDVEMNCQ